MAENIAQTVQKTIQELIAPDVRELKVQVASLQKEMDQRFESAEENVDRRFRSFEDKLDMQFDAMMAAFGEFKAESQLANVQVIAALSERVARLEVQLTRQ